MKRRASQGRDGRLRAGHDGGGCHPVGHRPVMTEKVNARLSEQGRRFIDQALKRF
ncbi:hypothetical protein J4G37_29605 [Microvirga sp. 3-52]|nr:hypothetical protein [Microvirga sp. 3-52]